jgi:UDP-N-acetylmuramoyl-tripeptide--D-alanyl-D-alanine ligase
LIPLKVCDVRHALGAGRVGEGTIRSVTTDSRAVTPEACFVALQGTRVDGARFIPDALLAGAVLAIGGESSVSGPRVLRVADPLSALGTIGRLVRDEYAGPVLGITGSAGKTTVKEFLRVLVEGTLRGVFPEASHNNLEGVPRTLVSVEEDTEVLVVELGTNAPGEIAALCDLARPTLGLITAIGKAHLEGLGSVEGVLDEKLSLARSLPAGAPLYVNADDPVLRDAQFPSHVRVIPVGLDGRDGVLAPPADRASGTLPLPGGAVLVHHLGTRVLERNLWIALMVARDLGVPEDRLVSAAATVRPARLRGERRSWSGSDLILDCYNANPLSMEAAISDLAQCRGRRVALVGEMLELGPVRATEHRVLGEHLARAALDRVAFIGASAADVEAGYLAAGGDPRTLECWPDVATARPRLGSWLEEPATVLLKASRGIALERLLEGDHG